MASQAVDTLSHQAWSTEDGLPQSSVHAITQTGDGYLWVGTEAGLARFDGVQFEVFTHSTVPALRSDDICCLQPDGTSGLWIGTRDGWVHRTGQGFRWYGQGPPAANESHPAANPAWSWSTGQVQGLLHGNVHGWRAGVDLPAGQITQVAVDRSGRAWVGMSTGLAVIDPATGAARGVAAMNGASVLSIFEDAQGNHWIGTESSGLHILRRQLFRSVAGLLDSPTTAVARTTDGTVWVGTREDGLYRVRDGVVDRPIANQALTSPVVLCLQPTADGGLWVGTPDGLNRITADKHVQRMTTVNGLPDDYIRSLAVAPDGSVWAGTRHGLDHIQNGQHRVFTTMEGLGGDLIGALLLEAAAPGQAGIIWAATSGGLSRIAADGGVRTLTAADGLTSPIVSALAMDEARRLWIATRDGMVFTLAGSGLRPMFRLGWTGGAERTVQSIAFDPQRSLWIQLDRGIERIRATQLSRCLQAAPCELQGEGVVGYGRADGLRNDESVVTALGQPWLMPGGELWFPTRAGVAIADTGGLRTTGDAPPVAIERVTVDDTQVDAGQPMPEIPYGKWRLTLEYAGLDFISPTGVRYRCRLDGFDRGWQSVGSRRAVTYTNLSPGTYTFHLQARTNDGDWGAREATLQIRVLPPFYRRWWFALLVALTVAALLMGAYRLRLRVLRHRFDAVLSERNRMAREIHDTLTQDFVSTCLQLDIVAQQLRQGQVEKAMEQVRGARRFVTEGLAEARESLRELRSNESRAPLPEKLQHLAVRESFQAVRPRVEVEGDYRPLDPRSEREILRVAHEALMNAVRHAQPTETVVRLQYTAEALVLTVEDNGIGFDVEGAAAMQGHFGLTGMKERASVVDGDLTIGSVRGRGTTVRLRVPLTPPAAEREAR